MSADTPLDINVVFDAGKRGRRGKTSRSVRRRSRPTFWITLGLLNLAVSGSAYYLTWWKVDPFIYMTLIMHTPLPGVHLSDVDTAFAQAPGTPLGGLLSPGGSVEPTASQGPTFVGQRAAELIGVTAYSWLSVATAGALALALSSGTLLGRAGGRRVRRVGLILCCGGAALLGFAVYRTWSEFGSGYPPRHLRIGMGTMVALAGLLGLAIGHRTVGVCRFAGVMTILVGATTVGALYVGHLCGAISPDYATPTFLGLTFLGASAWGWLLLVLGPRWAR